MIFPDDISHPHSRHLPTLAGPLHGLPMPTQASAEGKENTPLKRKAADPDSPKKAKDRRASHAGNLNLNLTNPTTPPAVTSLRAPSSLPSSHLTFASLPFDDLGLVKEPWDEWIDWSPPPLHPRPKPSVSPLTGRKLFKTEAQLPTDLPSNPLLTKPDLTRHAAILTRIAYFADHASLLALRSASRALHAAAEQRLFAHVGVFVRGDTALLVSPDAHFHRLPFAPSSALRVITSSYAPPISVLDMLSCPPTYVLGQTLNLPILALALDTLTATTPLTLLRGERFELHPTTARAVLHVTPSNLEPGQTTAPSVVWHTHTWSLAHALANLLSTQTYYPDLTLVLDPFIWNYARSRESPALSYEAGCDILEALGNYLLTYPGRLTVVGAERYVRAGAWVVPRAMASGEGVTHWVRQEIRDRDYVGAFGGGEEGREAVERLTMVYTQEWEGVRGWEKEMETQRRLVRPVKEVGAWLRQE